VDLRIRKNFNAIPPGCNPEEAQSILVVFSVQVDTEILVSGMTDQVRLTRLKVSSRPSHERQ
jgi:hypothetical protein